MPLCDMTNKVIGRLTVIERDNTKPKGHGKPVYWICQCSCGNITSVRADHLREGRVKSCGCYNKESSSKRNFKDITGQKFGELTAIKPLEINEQNNYIWLCKCSCGNETKVTEGNLVSGHINSCGCIKSSGEKIIGNILIENKIPFQTQYSFNDLVYKQKLKFDFAIFKNEKLYCLIEFNGIQHYDKNNSWHTNDLERRDQLKIDYCKTNNIPLIIIPYWEQDKINFNYLKEKCNL